MFSDNNKISMRQLQILIICNSLGIGMIILPRIFFDYSMINMIPTFFLILAATNLINRATKNNENFFSCTQNGFLSAMLMVKIFLTCAWQLQLFSQIIKTYVLTKTPAYIINLILILSAVYLVSKGYEARARLSEILIWLIVLPLAIVFFITIFDIKNIPYDNANINLIKIFESIFIFPQLDYLFLCKPYIKKNATKKISEAIIFSWIAVVFLMYIIKMKIKLETPFPIIKLMSITDIPGGFIQNPDFFIISFIIISFFSLISGGIFFSNELFSFTGIKKYSILICSGIIFSLSLIPKNINSWAIYFLGTFFYFLLPIYILISNKREGDKN